jgi:hypothetical protein
MGSEWAAAAAQTPSRRPLGLVASTGIRSAPRILRPLGAIAQLGERLLCKQEVAGSIPAGSITLTKVEPAQSHTGLDLRPQPH